MQHVLAGIEPAIELAGHGLGAVEALAQTDVAFVHGDLEAGDGAFSDFGRGDQLGNGRAQRVLVGFEELQATVEQHAITDCQHEQDRDQALDHDSNAVAHYCASMGFPVPPAISNMAKVVLGLRKCLATRTMRPSVSVTSPQRTMTSASDFSSSISVSPTLSFMICLSGSCASYSTASTAICAWPISVARWPSQVGSRPNFSPMNICNSTSRIGSVVAYGNNSSMVPARSSMSMRSRTRIAALAGRRIA